MAGKKATDIAVDQALELIRVLDVHNAAIKMAERLKLPAEVHVTVGDWDKRGSLVGWTKRTKGKKDMLVNAARNLARREKLTNAALRPKRAAAAPSALSDIRTERYRQTAVEGWTAEHDDAHANGALAKAAACYARGSRQYWPWERAWWKPSDRRRDLVKAGALIVAEIERLDRSDVREGNGR
jgi:hypothetical protein